MPRFLTSWFPAAAGLAALAGVAFTAPAQAVPLAIGNYITVGDATITIDDCTGLCGQGEMVAAAGPTVGFIFEKLGGGGGTMVGAGGDISVSFEVTTTNNDINSIGLSAIGTGNASVGETVFDSLGCGISGAGSTASVGAGTTTIPLTYIGSGGGCSDSVRDVYISKDIAGNDGTVTSVLQQSVGDVVTPAPEPSGAAALVVGLIGLFWVRRRSA